MPKEVATRPTNSVAISPPQAWIQMRDELTEAATAHSAADSAAAITASIQARIAQAETLESVLEIANQGTERVVDWIDKPILLVDFTVLSSSTQFQRDNALNAYFLIQFVDMMTGTEQVMSTGGEVLVAVLWKMKDLGKLPLECAFFSNHTSNGFDVYKLRLLNDDDRRKLDSLKPASF